MWNEISWNFNKMLEHVLADKKVVPTFMIMREVKKLNILLMLSEVNSVSFNRRRMGLFLVLLLSVLGYCF